MDHDGGDWYEVIALVRDDEVEVLEHEEHRAYIHGKIEDVVVAKIQVDGQSPEQVQQSIEAAKIMLDKAGIETGLIIPGGIDLMRVRRVDNPDRAERLTQRFHDKLREGTTVH